MTRGGWSAPLLLLLLAPPLSAADAPLDGEVAFRAAPPLEGEATLAGAGALELGHAGPAGFTLAWGRAEGRRVWSNFTDVEGVPGLGGVADPRAQREPLRYGAGRLADLRCHAPCHVFLVPLDAGELALRARVDGVPGILRAQSLTYGGAPWRSETSFAHATPAGAWVVSRLGASGLVEPGETIVALPPRVALLLVNVTARVQTASADEPLDTRTRWDESRVGPVGATVERGQHVYLELDDPVLDLGPDAPFVLLLDAPSVRVLGAVGPVPADGWVAEAGRRRDLRGAALGLEGDVRLAPLPRDALAPGEAPAHAVSGEGRAVVDGLRSGPRVAEAAGAQATLAAALLGLALLARALLPLYSRIDKARALGHPSRRRILDLLAQAPGSTVGAICAGTGLGRAAIEHHLHVLGTHGVVAMARDGRRRRYHRRDAPPVGQEARRALTDATRRRIAGLLADGRVLTQRDLAAEAGVSKRLVCYHLARLADVGLVEPRPGLPRRYGATARLRDLMGQGDAAAHA